MAKKESKAVAVQEKVFLPSVDTSRMGTRLEGYEGLIEGDLTVPVRSLIQGQTQGDVSIKDVGGFVDKVDGTIFEELRMVILRIGHSRVFFDEIGSNRILCASSDGLHPRRPGIIVRDVQIPELCADCPFSQFQGDEVPPCKAAYAVTAADASNGELFMLRPSGMSWRPFKKYFNTLAKNHWSTFSVVTTVRSHEESNDKGKFYVMDFSYGEPFDKETEKAWQAYKRSTDAMSLRDSDEAEVDDVERGDSYPRGEVVDEAEPEESGDASGINF